MCCSALQKLFDGCSDPPAGGVHNVVTMDVMELRAVVYEHIAASGEVPSRAQLIDLVGGGRRVDELLAEAHERHLLVLDDRPERYGEIRMALPFAAEPTGFRVTTADGAWWANCAWDALAIPAALATDAAIEARWLDDDEPVDLRIANGQPVGDAVDGLIHFTIPARHWWDDIVFT